ncbi:hypothetical protein K4B79_44780 [Streptomyces lincolnensis]|jgi:hypothetical protein|uniref:hypothetical protein n=1 Tax=Streptomyces lincolnensis TaxID=1915 RepID=UPI001E380950|nr:hypothetical protein [Streptomyces lincolnensis]MCD7445284.1 hypothetical protein [Streptomyces lincolnensis]
MRTQEDQQGHGGHGGREAGPPPRRARWRRFAPVGINLLFGVPAVIPLHSAWLLLTEYRSCALDTAPVGLADCGDIGVVEGAGWARVGLLVVGGLGLLLLLAVDVLFPAATGRPWRRWLAASLAVPVPYLLAVITFAIFD